MLSVKMEIIELPSLEKHSKKQEIIELVNKAIPYFPELINDKIFLGITTGNFACARADTDNFIISFNPKKENSAKITTVFHELMHLVQKKVKEYPRTEESCDIFSLARIPLELINENEGGGYVLGEGIKAIMCAKQSLEYRNKGHRNYIQYYNKLIRDKKQKTLATSKPYKLSSGNLKHNIYKL